LNDTSRITYLSDGQASSKHSKPHATADPSWDPEGSDGRSLPHKELQAVIRRRHGFLELRSLGLPEWQSSGAASHRRQHVGFSTHTRRSRPFPDQWEARRISKPRMARITRMKEGKVNASNSCHGCDSWLKETSVPASGLQPRCVFRFEGYQRRACQRCLRAVGYLCRFGG
jgi:hypothetical protein